MWLSVDYLLRFEICRQVVPPYRTVVSAQSERGEVCVRVGDLFDQRLSPCPAPLNPRRVHLAARYLLLTEIKSRKKTIYCWLTVAPKSAGIRICSFCFQIDNNKCRSKFSFLVLGIEINYGQFENATDSQFLCIQESPA